jgi:dephospho-CoA kinase
VVVFVHSSASVRAARAAARRWGPGEFERREAAQAPLADKRARADFVLDNDGPLDAVARQVDDLLRRLETGPRRAGGGPHGPP